MKTKNVFILAWLTLCTLHSALSPANAQGTAFTYQGQLSAGGSPANGNYDFTFALFNNSGTNSGQAGVTKTNLDVGVTNGLFTVTLDFGAGIFTGPSYWLSIGVRSNGGAGFTALNPLQELTPAPYAIYTPNAGSAVTAANVTGPLALGQLPAAVVTNNETGVTLGGTFSGNGAALTNLTAADIAAGTAPISISGNAGGSAATAGVASNIVSGATLTNSFETNNTMSTTVATNLTPIYLTRWVGGAAVGLDPVKDVMIFCSTNATNSLPTSTVTPGKTFTVWNKSFGASVVVTCSNGTSTIQWPGFGSNTSWTLGTNGSASNVMTVTWDGTNY